MQTNKQTVSNVLPTPTGVVNKHFILAATYPTVSHQTVTSSVPHAVAASRTMVTPLAPPSECWRYRYSRCPPLCIDCFSVQSFRHLSSAVVLWVRVRRFRQQ